MAGSDDIGTPDRDLTFRKVFEEYYGSVYHFFAKRDFSAEDCYDFTQETFLRAYKGIARFRYEAQLKTWIFRIATNIWHNDIRYRDAGKRQGTEISWEDTVGKDPSADYGASRLGWSRNRDPLEDVLAREQTRLLQEALEELPPGMRRSFILRIHEGRKYDEIAVLLNVKPETVRAQLFQARRRLQEKLGDYLADLNW